MKKKVRTKEEFMLRFRGVKVHHLTKALNRLTRGINWSGCSKGHIADSWANATAEHDRDKWSHMDRVELDALEQEIRKVEAGK